MHPAIDPRLDFKEAIGECCRSQNEQRYRDSVKDLRDNDRAIADDDGTARGSHGGVRPLCSVCRGARQSGSQ